MRLNSEHHSKQRLSHVSVAPTLKRIITTRSGKHFTFYTSIQTICFSTTNGLTAAFKGPRCHKSHRWCAMLAVFSDDPLCHPLPQCPRGDASHTEHECACVSYYDCVWEIVLGVCHCPKSLRNRILNTQSRLSRLNASNDKLFPV